MVARAFDIRPLRHTDYADYLRFGRRLDSVDFQRRFGMTRPRAGCHMARGLFEYDPDREIVLAAVIDTAMQREILGVARAVLSGVGADAAVIVRSDRKRLGIGGALFDALLAACRARGIRDLRGEVMRDNEAMLDLARKRGAAVLPIRGAPVAEVSLAL